jgi:hypothetical protein
MFNSTFGPPIQTQFLPEFIHIVSNKLLHIWYLSSIDKAPASGTERQTTLLIVLHNHLKKVI